MFKNTTYKEKFEHLKEWMPSLIETVKKDLRNEHLKKDVYFVKRFLASKNIHKVTNEELTEAYQKAIQEEEKGEDLAEFITSRWLLKNSELYEFFEKELTKINPDFATLEEIKPDQAEKIIKDSVQEYGATATYLFSVLNSVVFPEESFKKLKIKASEEQNKQASETHKVSQQLSLEQAHKEFEKEIAKLTDKYEKKLSGLQKKYVTDVESLKKQISQLQRKLQPQKS